LCAYYIAAMSTVVYNQNKIAAWCSCGVDTSATTIVLPHHATWK